MPNKHLLILETLKDAEYYLNNVSLMPVPVQQQDIISTQPDIQAYLLQNNIQCNNSADFMGPDDHHLINDKIEMIDEYIGWNNVSNLNNTSSQWVRHSFEYYFRYLCYFIFWDIKLITNILSNKNYTSIVSFTLDGNTISSPAVLPEERYIGKILKLVAEEKGIKFIEISANGTSRIDKPAHSAFHKIARRICYNIFHLGAKKFAKNKFVLISNTFKNMDLLCNSLLNDNGNLKFCKIGVGSSFINEVEDGFQILLFYLFNFRVVDKAKNLKIDFKLPLYTIASYHKQDYNEKIILKYANNIINQLENESNNLFVIEQYNLIHLIIQKAQNHILPFLLEKDFLSFGLRKGLSLVQPDFVISQMSLSVTCALGYLSEDLDIPSVLISHGSHIKHEEKHSAREHEILANNILVGGYKYLGVQSPLAKEMAEKARSGSETIVNIQPVIWGRKLTKNKLHSNKITIVHAGTFKTATRRFMYETSDEMLKGLSELTAIISDKLNLEMIIKFRAGPEFSLDSLNLLLSPLPENVVIDNERPFFDVLGEADLLISFSSTTIEEALVNKIPVLLYGGGGRYSHIPVEPYESGNSIEKAVTFIKRKEQLIDYFTFLNQKGSSFTVQSEEFDPYRFKNRDAVEFSNWFADEIKSGAVA